MPISEALIFGFILSVVIALVYYTLYLVVAKGFESPIRLSNSFKSWYRKHARNKSVKNKMYEYETISGMHKPSLLGSTIAFAILVLIISLLLFKVVFFTVVTSGSMSPALERGDLVLMQRIQTEPAVGDIITLEREEIRLPITHRVVAVTEEGVRTKGDARGRVDPWLVPEEEIKAKAVVLGETPVVLKDIGNKFILDASKQTYVGRYGTEYSFMKNLFSTLKMYGYVFCIIAILGYVILTIKEHK